MIFSIHIPKTAGTSFRNALAERYGPALALYYGAKDRKTHPLLRVPRKAIVSRLPLLEAEGVAVLHGHYAARFVEAAIDDPAKQVWTWLRDPVERVLSHHAFYAERPVEARLGSEVRDGGLPLLDFAARGVMRDVQRSYLGDLSPGDLAFVGVTERFELGLAMLFGDEAPRLTRRFNATAERAEADRTVRDAIAALNARDVELYAEALRSVVDRLSEAARIEIPERPESAAPGLLKRLFGRVA